jgi:hypothetical protein
VPQPPDRKAEIWAVADTGAQACPANARGAMGSCPT